MEVDAKEAIYFMTSVNVYVVTGVLFVGFVPAFGLLLLCLQHFVCLLSFLWDGHSDRNYFNYINYGIVDSSGGWPFAQFKARRLKF